MATSTASLSLTESVSVSESVLVGNETGVGSVTLVPTETVTQETQTAVSVTAVRLPTPTATYVTVSRVPTDTVVLDDSTDSTGLIVGIVVLLLVCCLLIAILLLLRKRRSAPSSSPLGDDAAYTSYNEEKPVPQEEPPPPQYTTFTQPQVPHEMKEVVVGNGGGAVGLVVVTPTSYDDKAAVKIAESLGAGTVRVLSADRPDKPTRASILAGLRWLTATAEDSNGDVVIVIVADQAHVDSGGFLPSDHGMAGPIKSGEILNELSLIPQSRVAIVYDVPSTKPVWSLPYSVAPAGCAAPGQPRRSPAPRHHLLLLSPNGPSLQPGDLVTSMTQTRELEGPLRTVLDDLHRALRHDDAFPVFWSNRGLQNTRFPFTHGMESTVEYEPPAIVSPGGAAPAVVPDPGFASPQVISPLKVVDDPAQPLWFKQLSSRAGSGGPAGYDSDNGSDKQFPSWVSVNPQRGSPTRPRPVMSHQTVFERQPTSRRPGSPENLVWGSPQRRSPLYSSPQRGRAPPVPAFSPQLGRGSPQVGRASPSRSRPASPAAAELSDTLYSPGRTRVSGENAPEAVSCLLQSLTSIPHYSYKRGTMRNKFSGDWVLELQVEGDSEPLEIRIDDITRCGAEESGGTDYPDTAMFIVPSSQARIVLVLQTSDLRDAWISWVHSLRPDSVVILPSTFSMPTL